MESEVQLLHAFDAWKTGSSQRTIVWRAPSSAVRIVHCAALHYCVLVCPSSSSRAAVTCCIFVAARLLSLRGDAALVGHLGGRESGCFVRATLLRFPRDQRMSGRNLAKKPGYGDESATYRAQRSSQNREYALEIFLQAFLSCFDFWLLRWRKQSDPRLGLTSSQSVAHHSGDKAASSRQDEDRNYWSVMRGKVYHYQLILLSIVWRMTICRCTR